MQDKSSAKPAHASSPADVANALLDRIETELERLRRSRPQLADRVRKASNIIVAHVAGRPRTPVVRVRITPSGRARFLFNSLTGNGATYVVVPLSWSCTCPAAHRYEGPCKHSLSAYVLWRASLDRSRGAMVRRDPDGSPACPGCDNGIVRHTRELVHPETGELVERTVSLPCRRCSGGAA